MKDYLNEGIHGYLLIYGYLLIEVMVDQKKLFMKKL